MKTTLGVGISVLSALAAQGKDFDRTCRQVCLIPLGFEPRQRIHAQALGESICGGLSIFLKDLLDSEGLSGLSRSSYNLNELSFFNYSFKNSLCNLTFVHLVHFAEQTCSVAL